MPVNIVTGTNNEFQELSNAEGLRTLQNNEDDAVAYLNVRCYGKLMDEHYVAYTKTLFNEWCDAHHIHHNIRHDLFRRVILRHRDKKLNQCFWTPDTIRRAKAHNDSSEGRCDLTCWYKPWTWGQHISLSEENFGRTSYKWVPFAVGVLGGVILMNGVNRYVFRK